MKRTGPARWKDAKRRKAGAPRDEELTLLNEMTSAAVLAAREGGEGSMNLLIRNPLDDGDADTFWADGEDALIGALRGSYDVDGAPHIAFSRAKQEFQLRDSDLAHIAVTLRENPRFKSRPSMRLISLRAVTAVARERHGRAARRGISDPNAKALSDRVEELLARGVRQRAVAAPLRRFVFGDRLLALQPAPLAQPTGAEARSDEHALLRMVVFGKPGEGAPDPQEALARLERRYQQATQMQTFVAARYCRPSLLPAFAAASDDLVADYPRSVYRRVLAHLDWPGKILRACEAAMGALFPFLDVGSVAALQQAFQDAAFNAAVENYWAQLTGRIEKEVSERHAGDEAWKARKPALVAEILDDARALPQHPDLGAQGAVRRIEQLVFASDAARREALASALLAYGLTIRSDSQFCRQYVSGAVSSSLEEVVAIMRLTARLFATGHRTWSQNMEGWKRDLRKKVRVDGLSFSAAATAVCRQTPRAVYADVHGGYGGYGHGRGRSRWDRFDDFDDHGYYDSDDDSDSVYPYL